MTIARSGRGASRNQVEQDMTTPYRINLQYTPPTAHKAAPINRPRRAVGIVGISPGMRTGFASWSPDGRFHGRLLEDLLYNGHVSARYAADLIVDAVRGLDFEVSEMVCEGPLPRMPDKYRSPGEASRTGAKIAAERLKISYRELSRETVAMVFGSKQLGRDDLLEAMRRAGMGYPSAVPQRGNLAISWALASLILPAPPEARA